MNLTNKRMIFSCLHIVTYSIISKQRKIEIYILNISSPTWRKLKLSFKEDFYIVTDRFLRWIYAIRRKCILKLLKPDFSQSKGTILLNSSFQKIMEVKSAAFFLNVFKWFKYTNTIPLYWFYNLLLFWYIWSLKFKYLYHK